MPLTVRTAATIAVAATLTVGCTTDIDTSIDDRCTHSDDNQFACWLAAEHYAPNTAEIYEAMER